MRLGVARCEGRYSGRLSAVLPEALRLLMFKSDGSVMVHSDAGGYKPENWMTPPTVIEETDSEIVVRKVGAEDRLDIRLAEVVSDTAHDMGEAAAETLALTMNPWPRARDADEWLASAGVKREEDMSPFAALKGLGKKG